MEIQQLGPYKLIKRIGKGGMGSVYEAIETEFTEGGPGERVAVKVLSPQLAMAEGFRERFEAEIESLKILQHPGIVRLLGYGEDGGTIFYSMELVDGPSLEQELAAGRRFDWKETLQIGIQVCRALKHAHDHGVVHRDIKPANLLLAEGDQVKIADFGIARLFGSTQLTTAGGVLGTADYMSPEQAEGSPVTEKCDQYSLGSVMYALLSGRPPFRAKSMPEMLQMQRYAEAEPVTRYAPRTPAHLEKLINQLLSKEPDERFPNIMVLARHMEAMLKALSRPKKEEAAPEAKQERTPLKGNTPAGGTAASQTDVTIAHESGILATDDSIDLLIPEEVYNAATMADSGELELADPPPGVPTTAGVTSATQQVGTSPAKVQEPTKRFTTVDEEQRLRKREQGSDRLAVGAQVVGLLAALAAVVGTGWWMLKPPTADELFATIESTFHQNGTRGIRDLADELEQFGERFPNDPRQGELKDLRSELELQRLGQKLRAQSRFAKIGSLHPIQQLYSEAISLEEQNPAEAAAVLEDLLSLYPRPTETLDEEQVRWLELAERQFMKMQAATDEIAGSQLPELKARLAEADKLSEIAPEAAREIYAALVGLYQDKLWAKAIVETAKQRLRKLANE
ncbi:serine/threonine protein kinase [Adhaeretor mobilis]|uniref:Serine/threonine-protein kinase PrkC n=1 Tax=Adhaeretor mobilis TaxID=1930276 RepID=A0A517MV50_9BACT|nr:serine/threonine-protein kinase [Adhaeretor mobilis]QDS98761.1 Serine/threonine-protein kinase PrkC [Adhaeretor mobilis]